MPICSWSTAVATRSRPACSSSRGVRRKNSTGARHATVRSGRIGITPRRSTPTSTWRDAWLHRPEHGGEGVVDHPRQWGEAGYHEIQEARRIDRIVDRATLSEVVAVSEEGLARAHEVGTVEACICGSITGAAVEYGDCGRAATIRREGPRRVGGARALSSRRRRRRDRGPARGRERLHAPFHNGNARFEHGHSRRSSPKLNGFSALRWSDPRRHPLPKACIRRSITGAAVEYGDRGRAANVRREGSTRVGGARTISSGRRRRRHGGPARSRGRLHAPFPGRNGRFERQNGPRSSSNLSDFSKLRWSDPRRWSPAPRSHVVFPLPIDVLAIRACMGKKR